MTKQMLCSTKENGSAEVLDYRYAPQIWRSTICLIDDWNKTLVDHAGALFYDPVGKCIGGLMSGVRLVWPEVMYVESQTLLSPRIPIVQTVRRGQGLRITEEVFAVPVDGMDTIPEKGFPNRNDILLVTIVNEGHQPAVVQPVIDVYNALRPVDLTSAGIPGFSELLDTPIPYAKVPTTVDGQEIRIGVNTSIYCTEELCRSAQDGDNTRIELKSLSLQPGQQIQFVLDIAKGPQPSHRIRTVADVEGLRRKAVNYWKQADLPYDTITVPDAGVQNQLDACIRNIYQAREIKAGLPAFQVGPEVYRGMWVVDGAFLTEAVQLIGRGEEARKGIEYLLGFQKQDGSFLLIPAHWKETGIMLWVMYHHARLSGDKRWLLEHWTQATKAMEYIRTLRRTMNDPSKPNYDLLPNGISDGGIQGDYSEYTNIYWTLIGMKAAVAAAEWLEKNDLAQQWQKEYDSLYAAFRKAAKRDMKTHECNSEYLPITMEVWEKFSPQKAQWAFLHAVYPGELFAADDPLARGNLAMLEHNEVEGLIRDTGWLPNGLWTYFGSFYGHAWLWLGKHDKAVQALYDFGNHASPVYTWREEHMPQGEGEHTVGDMPHNWASAEFIRLIRHLLVLERGDDLHLLEAIPAGWIYPGAKLSLKDIATEFGAMSFQVTVSEDGTGCTIQIQPPTRETPRRIVLHLEAFGKTETMELQTDQPQTIKIKGISY